MIGMCLVTQLRARAQVLHFICFFVLYCIVKVLLLFTFECPVGEVIVHKTAAYWLSPYAMRRLVLVCAFAVCSAQHKLHDN